MKLKISSLFAYLYLIGSILYSVYLFNIRDISNALLLLSYLGLLLVPLICKKLFKLKLDEVILSSYYIFLILASLFGVFMRFYSIIPWYDDFVHFLSGFLVSYFALFIVRRFDIKNKVFIVIFIISFSLGIAALWEFFEYFIDILLDKDLQKVVLFGVKDTMNDMLMAFLSSIIFSIGYIFKTKKN